MKEWKQILEILKSLGVFIYPPLDLEGFQRAAAWIYNGKWEKDL